MLIAVRVANSQGRSTFSEIRSPVNKVLAPRKTMPNRLRRNKTCSTATSAVSHLIPASWMAKHRPPITVMEMPRLARSTLIDFAVNWVTHCASCFPGWSSALTDIDRRTVYLIPSNTRLNYAAQRVNQTVTALRILPEQAVTSSPGRLKLFGLYRSFIDIVKMTCCCELRWSLLRRRLYTGFRQIPQ